MKKLFVIVFAGAMLSACSHGPKKDEPLGFKTGMTVEDVRSRVQLVDERPSIFYKNETIAKADKIDADVAPSKDSYSFSFKDGKLSEISAVYSGKENIEKVENYLNQVANCQRVDKENESGGRTYYCGYYDPERSNQRLASFAKFNSILENNTPMLSITYTFMK